MTEQNTAGEEQQEAAKTFTVDDVNRIVAERVKRVKSEVPADYDDLKAKAAKFDELEEANKSELEKAQSALNAANAKLEQMEAERTRAAIRASVAQATGVPANLISGDDEEAMTASAQAIAAYVEAQKPSFPSDKGGAGGSGVSGITEQDINKARNSAERVRMRAKLIAQQR